MKRARLVLLVVALALVALAAKRAFVRPFPPDTTPEGAYLRIALALTERRDAEVFPYLETDSQWAAISIHEMRREAASLARADYPADEAKRLVASFREEAEADGGPSVFAVLSRKRGFAARLRKDLSGIGAVEVAADRASVVTARGTRYPFRRRENGIWGLTMFSAELVDERARAARDLDVIRAAAADYRRAGATGPRSTGSSSEAQPTSTSRPNASRTPP